MPENYRDFVIRYDPVPIPVVGVDWTATHVDYDGEGDGRHFRGASPIAMRSVIDDWHDEQGDER